MKMGLVQLEVSPYASLEKNREAQRSLVRQVFAAGANLVVLPECASHKYAMRTLQEVEDWAEPIDGPTVRLWESWAREHQGYIVGGILERAPEGLFNTAVMVGPNGYAGLYRKMHRFGWERQWLNGGDGLTVWRIRSLNLTLGVLICYDLRFGYTVSALADAGADVVAVPTTWTSVGKRLLWDGSGYAPQNHLVLGHAYAHRVYMVCADRVGREEDVTYLGASIGAGPEGEALLGPLSGSHPGYGVIDIDVERARQKRVGQSDLRRDRRWSADIPVAELTVE